MGDIQAEQRLVGSIHVLVVSAQFLAVQISHM